VALPFRDPFDAAMAQAGPPAVFTLDHKGQLGLNPERTRDAWQQLGREPAPGTVHALLRDRATGFVLYARLGSPELYADAPRADRALYPDEDAALAALRALGAPPVWRGPWPPPPAPAEAGPGGPPRGA
jgi:hypothetical protein